MFEFPTNEELYNRFHYLSPSVEGAERHRTLSHEFETLALLVRDTMPAGRELSIAMTKLEEAKFWASAGVARDERTR
jgi:hypothetical protein